MVLVPPSMTRQTTGMLQWVPFSEGEDGLAKLIAATTPRHQGFAVVRDRGEDKIKRLKSKIGVKRFIKRVKRGYIA
jgi:hypothetical protein